MKKADIKAKINILEFEKTIFTSLKIKIEKKLKEIEKALIYWRNELDMERLPFNFDKT